MSTSCSTLKSLISEILDFSKIEAGKMKLELTPIDPAKELQDVANVYANLAKQKGLEFELTIDPHLPKAIKSDSTRLKQLTYNLLSNAIKFTAEGKVSLHAHRINESAEMKLVVTDTGRGIGPKDMKRLFEEFVQADSTSTRRHGGTGLGLAITKRLTEMFGGHISVDSELGKGTEFSVVLPFEECSEKELPKSEKSAVLPFEATDMRILICEDNAINRTLAVNFVERLGLTCDVAANGLVGLKMLEKTRYDLVFMDLHMPVMDGFKATAAIRKDSFRYGKPYLIALTASAFEVDYQKCVEAGMNDYLSKPFRLADLRGVIQRAQSCSFASDQVHKPTG